MTENEAKIIIEGFLGDDEVINEALEMAVKALEEIKQYRAIGTVEELKALKENQRNCKDCAGCTVWKCDCANIRDKAIDDFVEKLKAVYPIATNEFGLTVNAILHREIDRIAKEMKGSDSNE